MLSRPRKLLLNQIMVEESKRSKNLARFQIYERG